MPDTTNAVEIARSKLEDGAPLTLEDGIRLYESCDIHTLGELANGVRERLHGRAAYFNRNLHINYTNYCVLRCKFCSFYHPFPKSSSRVEAESGPGASAQTPLPFRERGRREGDRHTPHGSQSRGTRPIPLSPREMGGSEGPVEPGRASADSNAGYELTVDDVVTRAKEAYGRGATEVHIVGGLHPTLPFSYYTDMCRTIRQACPHIHIKAFTAIEIIHFTRISRPRLSIREVLIRLREAGLDSLPGGGAEIFDERVHDEAFQAKVGEAEWFEVHRTAHELGVFTNSTMLYGHIETPAERIRHLIKLREHQEESLRSRKAHFNGVVPLSFIPGGSALSHLPGPTGLDDLRTLALSRLMCPNIPHVMAFWIMQTPKLAQVSLNWGVDDLDGTVGRYHITRREGDGTTRQALTVDELTRLIVEAGCTPVERDSCYRRVIRGQDSWHIEGEEWSVPFTGEG